MTLLAWYIPLGLLVILLWVLIRKRAYLACPWFFLYVAFGAAADIARFATRDHAHAYYATYWITEAGYDVLGILVMYEVLRLVLGSLARARWSRGIFLPLFVISAGLALTRAHAAPTQFGHGMAFYILVGEISVRFVQVVVFAGLVTLVPVLGLRWRQYPFGTALGFGLYATISLLINLKLSDFGTRFKYLWDITSLVAYSLAVLIWIWFFSAPQKAETPSPELSAPSPGDLKQYKDAIRRMR